MAMNASWMDAYCWFRSAAMAFAESSGDLRSSEGFSVANTIPELGLLVKPLMDSPGMAPRFGLPGGSGENRTSCGLHLRCGRGSRHSAVARRTRDIPCPG